LDTIAHLVSKSKYFFQIFQKFFCRHTSASIAIISLLWYN
jgi:hypothetical protein